ncbi:MAG: pantetheine-phosphate adenylyltransferase [bacterium]|nr:MAG: pantetheine-phosphate adenylyltransferase [bacterium]
MKTIAIYPGTFDPITNGHIDLIRRSASIFPKVIVLVAGDTKKAPLFNLDERVSMVREAVKRIPGTVRVEPFHGLLIDAVKKHSAKIIIRGLRAVSDFEYESQMALMNRRLEPGVETFFMISAEDYACLSSSFVKEIAGLGGNVGTLVPPGVKKRLSRLYSGRK